MSLVDSPKIRRATAAMNQVMFRLKASEAMIMLASSVGSVIAHNCTSDREREEMIKEHAQHVQMTVQKLSEEIDSKRRRITDG